ncbi:MAG: hypothetical protein DCC67_01325 [Planctomycetota bacterium]|nr:MAG: hypothetical protein DCC67_01325 [Planctomycetota bacterium]
MILNFLRLALSSAALIALLAASPVAATDEPSFESAKNWFPPLRNVWTPVGLKNHPFRFTLLYNGTVVAEPHPFRGSMHGPTKQYLDPFAGQGVQLTLTPSFDGALPAAIGHSYQLSSRPDGGVGMQSWNDAHAAPVLATRWPMNHRSGSTGVVLREEVFAHTPGGKPIKTGKEPLYLWMRLSVEHVDPLLAAPNAIMMIHIGQPHVGRSMWHEENLTVYPDQANYPRVLTRDTYQNGPLSCCRLVEPDGRVRLVGMLAAGSAMLEERTAGSRDYFLKVDLPAVKGTHIDLLIPMIPGDADAVRQEADLGYDAALAESDAYWAERPATAAVFDTPEPQVNRAVRRMVEIAQVVSETNPETGEKALLTGNWNYDTLWPTPACMATHMLLDHLGYHQFVAENLAIFRNHQGTTKPPGAAYTLHPGYLGAPKQLSSIDWLTDHGAVLHAMSQNALLSGDEKILHDSLEAIVKGCEFLRDARTKIKHDGVPGVLPPAVSTDTGVPTQAVWNIAWNYKGLDSAVRLLRRVGHPLADEYEAEAREFKDVFVKAFRERTATMPTWTNDAGVERRLVPTGLSGEEILGHPFFLDAGPMVLVYAGLFTADDPLMKDSVAYYREGPDVKLYDPRGNMHQRPILTHEISTCEPCYSFNILCSWQLGDRQHFLEGVYALLSGALSQQTFSGCEHRHGIWSLPAPGALMFYAMKLSVIDDVLHPDELHLLRLVPKAWVVSDYRTRLENIATQFGPVDLAFQLRDDGKTLDVSFHGDWRHAPQRIVLHVPPELAVSKVVVNGQEHAAVEAIELTP